MRVMLRGIIFVVAVLIASACGREAALPIPAPTPTIGADHHGKIDVLNAVLVMNDDGSATLSADIVNNTNQPRELGWAGLDATDADVESMRFVLPGGVIEPGAEVSAGGEDDPVIVRIARGATPGDEVPIELRFDLVDEYEEDSPSVSLKVPVVERTEMYTQVSGNTPNTKITIEDGKIFVIPGQTRALIDGTVVSSITDIAYDYPTATDANGKRVEFRHNTATGGPYSFSAEAGKPRRISSPPYTIPNGPIDADLDYFDAKDLTIGQKITVTIPFQTGDVKAIFTVVRG